MKTKELNLKNETLIRCNNCYKIYIEDVGNYKYIFECKNCKSGDYLMELTKTK